MGSEAIGSMCRSIAAWAEEVGKPKLSADEQEEEGATSGQVSSADLAKDPIVQTAIGAAALGLGGVGGLGRTSSEPSPSPAEEEEGSNGKALPMGVVGPPQLKLAEHSRYNIAYM